MKRINFAAGMLGDVDRPGVQAIISRLQAQGDLPPEEFVDLCLDLIGPLEVKPETRRQLVDHAEEKGALCWGTEREAGDSTLRVGEILKLIAAVREYQYS